MNLYQYLPHEWNYACFLANHYDLPYDSMIHNMVSQRYHREEDDDASASNSTSVEDEDSSDDEVLTVSAHILENSASSNRIVFGSFKSPTNPFSNHVIKPEFDGFFIKIGEISCFLVTSSNNIVDNDDSMFTKTRNCSFLNQT